MRHKNKLALQWLGFIIILVVIFGGLIWLGQPKDQGEANFKVAEVTEDEHIKGDPDAEITIIEYSCFECPACSRFYSVSKTILQENPNVRLVYRSFPLKNTHMNALLSAQAAEAASLQGKFWEMYDKLFENQVVWSKNSNAQNVFIKFAEELELDVEKFSQDLNSKEIVKKVDQSYRDAVRSNIESTPSIFLNNKKINTPGSYAAFNEMLEQSLEQK